MKPRVRVCIITRFSILIEQQVHSWRRLRNPLNPLTWIRPRKPTLDEKIAYLFAADRLEARFRRFEALLLPSVAAQTRAAEHIVLSSTLLPPASRDRLVALSKGHGFRLHFAGWDRQVDRILVEDGLIDMAGADRLATIRVDDDDAVATTFVDRVERFSHLNVDDYILSFRGSPPTSTRRSSRRASPAASRGCCANGAGRCRSTRSGTTISCITACQSCRFPTPTCT
ncbi:MAG: hypothetical protein H0T41_05070 [Rhodobacteraceae bacterium]|nr:hypothetical protein [Paracoccaceae bacterium]